MTRRFSLQAKFTAVTTLVAAAAVLLTTSGFLIYQSRMSREALLQELRTVAEVIAHNSTAALAFGDRDAAREILEALAAKADIMRGEIRGRDDAGFAEYRSGVDMPEPSGRVAVADTIWLDGEPIGEIRLTASLARLNAERAFLIKIALGIAAAAIALALLLSAVLRNVVLRPILHLAGVMSRVSLARDYTVRAQHLTNDELGDLICGFNGMVAQIERQHLELTQYRDRLEGLVAARTNELETANRNLQEVVRDLDVARTRSEAASRAKSEFLANMSHELRTPLNAILGFSEIILGEIYGPVGHAKYVEYARDIHHSGSHLLEMIGDILDVVRIETGKLTLTEADVDPAELIESALRLVRASAEEKPVRLEAPALEQALPRLRADALRLKQVLINLLSNAVKFTEPGGRVRIEASVDGSMVLRITDTGIGIAEEDLEKVLTPFGQVEGPFARRYQGTGLGLSLSKMLVERHGGTLTLESRLGVGTSVVISLPAERVVRPAPGLAMAGPREAPGC